MKKWLSNIAPWGTLKMKIMITLAKIWDSQKIRQLQSKPSHASQAKKKNAPEANNWIKVQLPPSDFFHFAKSYNCPDDLCGKIIVIDKIPIPLWSTCDVIEEDHLLCTHKIMGGKSFLCEPIPSSLDTFSTFITPEWNFKEHDTS